MGVLPVDGLSFKLNSSLVYFQNSNVVLESWCGIREHQTYLKSLNKQTETIYELYFENFYMLKHFITCKVVTWT